MSIAGSRAWRVLQGLPLALIAPILLAISAVVLYCADLFASIFSRRDDSPNKMPDTAAASIVIPNWNGRDLLEKYLPSVIAAVERCPGSEIIVVDNGSRDGS